MSNYYLDFEKPIKEIDEHILGLEAGKDLSKDDLRTLAQLKEERAALIQEIYSGLSRWQRIQLARHPDRPYSLDYIHHFAPDFIELHGDRHYMDDPAVVTGLGHLDHRKIAWIGQQKGRNTKENLHRNLGMMRPEGYRKAIRVMKLAEKFGLPVVKDITRKNAADRPLRPTSNPSELSIKLNALVKVTSHKTVNPRLSHISRVDSVL